MSAHPCYQETTSTIHDSLGEVPFGKTVQLPLGCYPVTTKFQPMFRQILTKLSDVRHQASEGMYVGTPCMEGLFLPKLGIAGRPCWKTSMQDLERANSFAQSPPVVVTWSVEVPFFDGRHSSNPLIYRQGYSVNGGTK